MGAVNVRCQRVDGVGTSIVGKPRRLSADRRARPTYTFIWEEPVCLRQLGAFLRHVHLSGLGRRLGAKGLDDRAST